MSHPASSISLEVGGSSSAQSARDWERDALEGGGVSCWSVDLATGTLVMNQTLTGKLGYTEANKPATFDEWIGIQHPEDRGHFKRAWQNHVSGKTESFEIDCRIHHQNGRWIWMRTIGKVVRRDKEGRPLVVAGVKHDVSKKKQLEIIVSEQSQLLSQLVNQSEDIIVISKPDGECLQFFGPSYFGVSAKDIIGKKPEEVLSVDEARLVSDGIASVVATGNTIRQELTITKEGRTLYYDQVYIPIKDDDGQLVAVGRISHNITSIRERELLFEQTKEAQRQLLNASREVCLLIDREGIVLSANNLAQNYFGVPQNQIVGQSFFSLVRQEHKAEREEVFTRALREKCPQTFLTRRDQRLYEGTVRPILNTKGEVEQIAFFYLDVTDTEFAFDRLRETEDRMTRLLEAAPFGAIIYQLTADNRLVCIAANQACGAILNVKTDEWLGKEMRYMLPGLLENELCDVFEKVALGDTAYTEEAYEYGDALVQGVFELHAINIGENKVAVFFQDISERIRAERALRQEHTYLKALVDNLPIHAFIKDRESRIHYINRSREDNIIGHSDPATLIGKTDFDLFDEQTAAQFYKAEQTLMASGKPLLNIKYERVDREGKRLVTIQHKVPVFNEEGQVIGLVGVSEDVTEVENLLKQQRRLLDHSPFGVQEISLREDGVLYLEYATKRADQILGFPLSSLAGQKYIDIFSGIDKFSIYNEYIECATNGTPLSKRHYEYQDDNVRGVFEVVGFQLEKGRIAVFFRDVSEEQRAAVALARSEELFRTLFEQAPYMIVLWPPDNVYGIRNREFDRILGWTNEDVDRAGSYMTLAFPTPNEREHAERFMSDTSGEFRDIIVQSKHLGLRQQRWVNIKLADGTIVEMGLDLTDYIAKDEELKLTEERFKTIFENAPFMLAIWSSDLRILQANAAYRKQVGWMNGEEQTPEFILERAVGDPVERERIKDFIRRAEGIFEEHDISTQTSGVRRQRWGNFRLNDGTIISFGFDITEIRDQELALEQSKRILRRVAENFPGAIYEFTHFPDGHSVVNFISEGVKQLSGITPEEYCAEHSLVYDKIPPQHLKQIQERIAESAHTLERYRCTFPIKVSETETHWVLSLATPERRPDGTTLFVGVMIDITDTILIREALLESERRYRGLFEDSPVALFEVDYSMILREMEKLKARHGASLGIYLERNPDAVRHIMAQQRYLSINRTALGIFDVATIEGFAANNRWIHESTTSSYRQLLLDIVRGQREVEFMLQTESLTGRPINALVRWIAMPGHEKTLDRVLVSMEDVTVLKEAEDELRMAKEIAEAGSKAKDAFLATISHEIRTPLNAIVGFSELLRYEGDEEQREDFIQHITGSAHHLESLVEGILEYSYITSGEAKMHEEAFEPELLLEDIKSLYSSRAGDKGISLVVERLQSPVVTLSGDLPRIKKAIGVLVDNAIKFTKEGSVAVSCELRFAERKENSRGTLVFRVTDTGPGIDPRLEARLFKPFEQADGSLTRSYGGLGLGLALCKAIANLLGGGTSYQTRLGQGSTFEFSVPCRVLRLSPIEQNVGESGAGVQGEAPSVIRPLRLIYAEDQKTNQLVMQALLRRLGCEALIVHDGQELIDILKRDDFDLVLLDMEMPLVSGFEATRMIRSGQCGKDKAQIPIVAVTAYAQAFDRDRILAAGINAFLPKPLNLTRLRDTIERVRGASR